MKLILVTTVLSNTNDFIFVLYSTICIVLKVSKKEKILWYSMFYNENVFGCEVSWYDKSDHSYHSLLCSYSIVILFSKSMLSYNIIRNKKNLTKMIYQLTINYWINTQLNIFKWINVISFRPIF